MADGEYTPPPDYSKGTLSPETAAPRFAGLYQATMTDNPPQQERQAPEAPPPVQREARQAPPVEQDDPGAYRPPPRLDARPEQDQAPAQAGADDGQDADGEAGADTPRLPQMPPGLSKAEQERFAALPPEAQAFIAEREQQRHNARSAEGREAAAQRQALAAIEQERAHYERELKGFLGKLDETYRNKWSKVDFRALAEKDPVEAQKQFLEYQAFLADAQKAKAEADAIAERQKQADEQRLREHLASEHEKLTKLIPDYADGRKREKLMRDLYQTGLDYGFEAEVVGNIADARMLHVLHDAMQWRRAVKARQEAERQPPSRALRPGTGAATPQAQRMNGARQRLRQTGSIEDAAAVFRGRLS